MRRLLGGAAVAAVLVCAAPAHAQDPGDVPPPAAVATPVPAAQIDAAVGQLDAIATRLLARTGVPGMAISVVHDGRVVYAKGFGVRNTRTGAPVDQNTVFQLASMSKPIGATVVARAVGRHQVAWTDLVTTYLPWFALKSPATTRQLQIADLYSHRSGLPDHAGDELEDLGYGRAQILRRLRYLPLTPIRSTYAYTNYGITAAAEAVARATHTNWARLSQRNLYGPLGMSSTSSRHADFVKAPNRADLHVQVDGAWTPRFQRDPDPQTPAGGVSSNVVDLARWMRLELDGGMFDGRRIVAASALLDTFTPHILSSPPAAASWRPGSYGLGWDTGVDQTGRVRLSHSGAFALGAGTTVWLVPDLRLGITVLTNGAPIGLPESVAQEFLDLAEQGRITRDWFAAYTPGFAALLQNPSRLAGRQPPAHPRPARAARAYAGRYAHNPYYGPATVTARGNRLTLHLGPGGRQAFPLRHWSGDTFSYVPAGENAAGPSAVTFSRVRDGHPTRLTIENLNAVGLGSFRR
jgi:CubicO group peptidase (beta-lactamase class C family)